MGRRPSPYGRRLSRLNATKHGVLINSVMKSMGPKCPFVASCPILRDSDLASACIPGDDCPHERAIHDAYIQDARTTFDFCLEWLSEDQFEETIHELAINSLQRSRLSALISREGVTRPKVHPVSGVVYGLQLTLAVGRYSTALDARYYALLAYLQGLACIPTGASSRKVSDASNDEARIIAIDREVHP